MTKLEKTGDLNLSRYLGYRQALAGKDLPAMVVDLDLFDQNAERLVSISRKYGKKLRPATKSIRVPFLIDRLLKNHPEVIEGLMCFSVDEACYLSEQGYDNLLVAYPTFSENEIKRAFSLLEKGKKIILMVDEGTHVQVIEKYSSGSLKMPLCIDVDMSLRLFGGLLHLGVQRSSIRNIEQFSTLAKRILESQNAYLSGVMGYEAQVAGLADRNPFSPFVNWAKHLIRKISVGKVKKIREEIHSWCNKNMIDLEFFNGGGTGSIMYAGKEPWLSEVTAGSGFLQSHLFDYYSEGHGIPAFFFALPVSRFPQDGIVTCKSGGFIASGEASSDKSPVPYLPEGLKIISAEGFGEVQTPFVVPSHVELSPGDPVFCRPCKAGEIAERFDTYYLVSKGEIVDEVKTYRGLGKCFY